MTDTKLSALDGDSTVGTYVTYVRPHQLRRTDVINDDQNGRQVVVETVCAGEVLYCGRLAGVLFVTGHDRFNGKVVLLTKTAWEFLEVQRIGDAPTFVRAVKVTDQYVY